MLPKKRKLDLAKFGLPQQRHQEEAAGTGGGEIGSGNAPVTTSSETAQASLLFNHWSAGAGGIKNKVHNFSVRKCNVTMSFL